MTMYALAIRPLIEKLRDAEPNSRQVWFADDATAAGTLVAMALGQSWQLATTVGPDFGYNPNASKTHLVVKLNLSMKQKGSLRTLMYTNCQRHLGAAIVHRSLCSTENNKMGKWNWKSKCNSSYSSPHSLWSLCLWCHWKVAINHWYQKLNLPTFWGCNPPPIHSSSNWPGVQLTRSKKAFISSYLSWWSEHCISGWYSRKSTEGLKRRLLHHWRRWSLNSQTSSATGSPSLGKMSSWAVMNKQRRENMETIREVENGSFTWFCHNRRHGSGGYTVLPASHRSNIWKEHHVEQSHGMD